MLRTFEMERLSLVSKKPFSEILAAIEAGVAHPDVSDFLRSVEKTHSADEMEQMINSAMKPKSLMLFMKFDQGEVLSKQADSMIERVIRLLICNPLIMAEMTRRVPDAGSDAPVTVLLDERSDGTHLSYDTMASLLRPYGDAEVSKIAEDLDYKILDLLQLAIA